MAFNPVSAVGVQIVGAYPTRTNLELPYRRLPGGMCSGCWQTNKNQKEKHNICLTMTKFEWIREDDSTDLRFNLKF